MSAMKMPGFTAEMSIQGANPRYRMSLGFDLPEDSAGVEPALPMNCARQAWFVWHYYDIGDYARAQVWFNIMENNGCFA